MTRYYYRSVFVKTHKNEHCLFFNINISAPRAPRALIKIWIESLFKDKSNGFLINSLGALDDEIFLKNQLVLRILRTTRYQSCPFFNIDISAPKAPRELSKKTFESLFKDKSIGFLVNSLGALDAEIFILKNGQLFEEL